MGPGVGGMDPLCRNKQEKKSRRFVLSTAKAESETLKRSLFCCCQDEDVSVPELRSKAVNR